MNTSLDEIMEQQGSDKANWKGEGHNYCDIYETFFSPFRDKDITLLELGIDQGCSLRGWAEYFSNAHIFGIDIDDKRYITKERIETFQCSQDDSVKLKAWVKYTSNPHIIIDDASHFNDLTIKSFQVLFPLLRAGGIYVIEDISCSYRWDFGGSIDLKNANLPTTMNYLFSMLHSLNPINPIADQSYQKPQEFIDIESVHFYPDMVVIKKKS